MTLKPVASTTGRQVFSERPEDHKHLAHGGADGVGGTKEWTKPMIKEPIDMMSPDRYQQIKRDIKKQINKSYGR